MKFKKLLANFRKFLMHEDSFPKIIKNVGFLLQTMTINIFEDKRTPWIYYFTTCVSAGCYFYVYIFSVIWLTCFRFSISEDFVAISVVVSMTCASITCYTKLFFMILNASPMRKIVRKFLALDAQVKPETRFGINLRKYLRVVNKRAFGIWLFLIVNSIFYLVLPFLSSTRSFGQGFLVLYGMEPILESPNYEIGQIVYTIATFFCVYVMINISAFVIVLVGYNEALLYAMTEELSMIWNDSQDFYNEMKHTIQNKIHAVNNKDNVINEFIRKRLIGILHYHVTNIQLFQEFNYQLRGILLIEYSYLIVAIIADLLGGLENTYIEVPYTFVQIVMDCLSGQRLVDACNEFEKTLYACAWENFNVSNKKTVLVMFMISQKTLVLSAGGMANLDYTSLMAILNSSYSAYTTLKSSMQK